MKTRKVQVELPIDWEACQEAEFIEMVVEEHERKLDYEVAYMPGRVYAVFRVEVRRTNPQSQE